MLDGFAFVVVSLASTTHVATDEMVAQCKWMTSPSLPPEVAASPSMLKVSLSNVLPVLVTFCTATWSSVVELTTTLPMNLCTVPLPAALFVVILKAVELASTITNLKYKPAAAVGRTIVPPERVLASMKCVLPESAAVSVTPVVMLLTVCVLLSKVIVPLLLLTWMLVPLLKVTVEVDPPVSGMARTGLLLPVTLALTGLKAGRVLKPTLLAELSHTRTSLEPENTGVLI